MENSGATKWVRIGDYVSEYNVLNTDNKIKIVKSVSVFKEFRDTGAKVDKNELRKYKIVLPGMMSYVQTTKNEKCFACCVNHFDYPIVVTSVNKVLSSNNPEILNIDYLFLILSRNEFDRFAIFNSWGSAREVFQWEDLMNVQIPLPSIEVQKELVEVYNGLKTIAEQNEALIEPITKACEAFIIDCKNRFPEVALGELIEECLDRNKKLFFNSNCARGVYCDGTFGETKANLSGSNLGLYKIVNNGDFAYSNRINIGSIALNNDRTVIISPSYTVFRITSDKLLKKFLFLLFRRKEFLRSTLFYAFGTIKDDFSYERMAEVKIPLPPIKVQQSIINVFECLEQSKKIAAEAREKLKNLCPALVQRAANS